MTKGELLYLMSKATYLVSYPIKGKATYAVPIEYLKQEYEKLNEIPLSTKNTL